MPNRNIVASSLALAVVFTLVFGALTFAQDSTTSTPATGSPTPSGTPTGGWKEWQTMELIDVQTGKTFTLADFYGKTVLIQPMATWCPNCKKQQHNILEARNAEGGEEILVISISVETTLDEKELLDYAKAEGFDWPFVVASDDLLKALVDEFGRSLANPPSTPHFLLLPDGTFTELETGSLSAEEIAEWIETAESK